MNLCVFGAGSALKDFLSILPDAHSVLAVADNDRSRHGERVERYEIVSPEALVAMPADLFVIAARAVDDIRAQLQRLGVPAERIAAFYPSYSRDLGQRVNEDIVRLNAALGTRVPLAGVASMYLWPDRGDSAASMAGEDFVRRHAMRLAADWITQRGVAGNIAELGVFQGEQAELLNRMFPERTLHLFDTFQGFAEADVQKEGSKGYSAAALGDFKNTSVERVLARMPHPDKVEMHPGMFPGTAQGVEDTFAFVSLDVDLFDPTLAGLEYFYPRLSPGGFLFVHDYNNKRYSGVRHAVEQFLDQTQAPAIPLPDFAGTLVILR